MQRSLVKCQIFVKMLDKFYLVPFFPMIDEFCLNQDQFLNEECILKIKKYLFCFEYIVWRSTTNGPAVVSS